MAYRDAFRLLLTFCNEVHNIPPEKLTIEKLDDKIIIQYLDWLQKERKCTIASRNQRLAAIHTFFRYIQMQDPEKLLVCQRILQIPFKKAPKTLILNWRNFVINYAKKSNKYLSIKKKHYLCIVIIIINYVIYSITEDKREDILVRSRIVPG
jgi:site-specific recombinase XerD